MRRAPGSLLGGIAKISMLLIVALVTSSGGLYLLLPAPTRLGLLRANGVGAGFAQLNAGKKLPGI